MKPLLINNAGIAIGGPLLEIPMEQIRLQFEVNIIGLIKVTQVFTPLLKSNQSGKSAGRILMISSVSGEIGMPFIGPYSGSKHALEGISKSLRRELQLFDIKVIVLGPGAIKTPIWDKSLEPVASQYQHSEFSESISIFSKKFVSKAAAGGLEVENFAEKTIKILESNNPKNRYVMVSFWFTNWFIPRYIPEKWLDWLLKHLLKLQSGKI
jgi:short-subunit dehydrogenase